MVLQSARPVPQAPAAAAVLRSALFVIPAATARQAIHCVALAQQGNLLPTQSKVLAQLAHLENLLPVRALPNAKFAQQGQWQVQDSPNARVVRQGNLVLMQSKVFAQLAHLASMLPVQASLSAKLAQREKWLIKANLNAQSAQEGNSVPMQNRVPAQVARLENMLPAWG